MALFAGTFENKVDAKGRVSIPAPFRAELEGQAPGGVYLYPSLTSTCLTGCTVEWMEEMKAGLKSLPTFSKKRQALTTAIFGRARLVKLDDDGRIVLPRDFADQAGIDNKAAFVGLAETFEIWNPDAAAKAQEDAVSLLLEEGLEFSLDGDT
ncbi:MAG: division/cell wall cluster transcriptional repressor MraZ [Magnetospiraceae bacterium]